MAKPETGTRFVIPLELKNKCRITKTETGRLYYPRLKEAVAFGNAPEKFSASIAFKKSNPKTEAMMDVIKKAERAATIAAWGPNKLKWPKGRLRPYKDGDKEEFADKEGYPGHWIVSANSTNRPGLVTREDGGKPVKVDADEIESVFTPGAYVQFALFASPYDYLGKKGVKFTLDGVCKIKEGAPMGGRIAAEEAFADADEDGDDEDSDEDEDDSEDEDEDESDGDEEDDEDEAPRKKKKAAKKKKPAADEDEGADDDSDEDEDESDEDEDEDESDEDEEDDAPPARKSKKKTRR